MKDKFPLVSILIPAYNQTKYLKIALESAINQTYENIEIIVGDDSTTNDVELLVSEYIKNIENIKYVKNNSILKKYGKTNCENLFLKAKGEYISFLYHDDVYYPSRIEKMVKYFCEDETLSLVTSGRDIINNEGEFLGKSEIQLLQDSKISGTDIGRSLLFSMYNFIGEPTTVMFRKKDIINDSVGIFDYYDSTIVSLVDISLFLKLASKGNVFFIKESLSKFRVHPEQNTSNSNVSSWFPIDFFNMIIDSYEQNLFIYSNDELMTLIETWKRVYSESISKLIMEPVVKKGEYESFFNKINKYSVKI